MFDQMKPHEIELKSFEIISQEMGNIFLDPLHEPIIKRAIHTSADFDYLKNLYFSEDVIKLAINAIKNGADILTDTNMARSGINSRELKKFGGNVYCFMSDDITAKTALENGTTRATVCMDKAVGLSDNLIIAVGNAPTALIRLRQLCDKNLIHPKVVVAVPVGFVNVEQSKELFVNYYVPSIVARGRKGGSNIAAAICNALIYMSGDSEKYGI